jgi:hypothetical protein
VTAGRVKRIVFSLQTTHHEAAFERADDQRGHFGAIDIRPHLASSLSFLGDRGCIKLVRSSDAIEPSCIE